MSESIQRVDGVYRATCEWTHTRELAAGSDRVSPEDNQDICERVAVNHAHRCPASGDD